MCKSKVDLPKPAKQSSTNVWLLNLSENSTGVLIAEVLMMVILLFLIFFVFKWCCKSYRWNNEWMERNLQEMIQRVESRPTASDPALAQAPARSIPAVSFENPGDIVVFMQTNNSEWDRYKSEYLDNQRQKMKSGWMNTLDIIIIGNIG